MRPSLPRLSSRAATAIGVAAIVALLPGCTQLRSHQGYIVDQALVDSIQPGIDNRASVERTLGHPTFANQFGVIDGRGQMVTPDQASDWYYVARNTRQLAFARPRATEQLTLRVHYDALGNVATVTRTGVDQVRYIRPESAKTPTLGRERSFFEELFGNIGTVGLPGGAGQGGAGGGGSSGG